MTGHRPRQRTARRRKESDSLFRKFGIRLLAIAVLAATAWVMGPDSRGVRKNHFDRHGAPTSQWMSTNSLANFSVGDDVLEGDVYLLLVTIDSKRVADGDVVVVTNNTPSIQVRATAQSPKPHALMLDWLDVEAGSHIVKTLAPPLYEDGIATLLTSHHFDVRLLSDGNLVRRVSFTVTHAQRRSRLTRTDVGGSDGASRKIVRLQ